MSNRTGKEQFDESYHPAFHFSSVGPIPSVKGLKKEPEEKLSIFERFKVWLKNRQYEPFFRADRVTTEILTENRKQGGA